MTTPLQKIITRSDALKQGLKTYHTGHPCNKGHISDRYTNNFVCLECNKINTKDYRTKNPENYKRLKRNYVLRNPKKEYERAKRYREANQERYNQHSKKYRERHPERISLLTMNRIARKAMRTPKWADLEAIEKIYINRPKGFQVDHEIPLNGEFVSGLHVESNLQYLSAKDNLSKRNHFGYWWL